MATKLIAAMFFNGLILLEQLENKLTVLIGDGERLHAQLLLCLQGLQACGGVVHIGVDERADACLVVGHQGRVEIRCNLHAC